MTDTLFTANPAQAQQIEADIRAASSAITSTIEMLKAEANSALANWSSDAKQNYEQVKAEWDALAASLNQQLIKACGALNTIMANYQQTDQRIAGQFQGGR
ncbi:WXG100 family type VII secretion target [Saccharopolyspora sp. 5N708]|uniref:WXG100 family type VII secretion target n=1 Tax=Saccharopolyspora sp. 5N708 TaxID=3457424 RepID=UPI003FD153B4